MKMTKFDKYMKVYTELIEEFKSIDNETIRRILGGWLEFFEQIEDSIESKKIRKSDMTTGLEQGLRELPEIISELPEFDREVASQKLNRVMNNIIPGFY